MTLLRSLRIWLIVFLPLVITACGGGGGGGGAAASSVDEVCTINPRLALSDGQLCSIDSSTPVFKLQILGDNGRTTGICSSVAIGPRVLLTAAHCLPMSARRIIARTGSQEFESSSFYVHPLFVEDDTSNPFDIGLVTFDSKVFSSFLPLLTSEQNQAGDRFIFFGYGRSRTEPEGASLQEILALPLRSAAFEIAVVYDDDFGRFITAADSNASSACPGDSGGPAIRSLNTQSAVIGIGSARFLGGACTNQRATFFASIQPNAVRSFIIDTLAALNLEPVSEI